jgi:hypothetical protein
VSARIKTAFYGFCGSAGGAYGQQKSSATVERFARLLARFLLHELHEAVRFRGELLDDPHAGGR